MKDKIYNSNIDLWIDLASQINDYVFDAETQTYIPA